MFKITPVRELSLHKEYAEKVGVPYREGYFAYSMTDYDTNELMGFSQFEIDERGGLLADIAEVEGQDDFEAMFILGRQTMNFMNMCGAIELRAEKNEKNEKLLLAIGFRADEKGNFVCNTEGMFDGHCGGHKVEL